MTNASRSLLATASRLRAEASLSFAMRLALRVARLNGYVFATSCVYRRHVYPIRLATLQALERRGLLVLYWCANIPHGEPL